MIMASNFTQEPTAPHEQTFVLRINWLANDRAIVESFEKNVCAARPQEFKECAIAPPPSQQSFDGSRLPFRKNSALMWLGVYRRRKAVAEWSNYVELYHPEESRFGLSTSIAHGDLIRARREDCRKAKLILGWFKDGTPLRKKDFK
jgi:hypothetical protein